MDWSLSPTHSCRLTCRRVGSDLLIHMGRPEEAMAGEPCCADVSQRRFWCPITAEILLPHNTPEATVSMLLHGNYLRLAALGSCEATTTVLWVAAAPSARHRGWLFGPSTGLHLSWRSQPLASAVPVCRVCARGQRLGGPCTGADNWRRARCGRQGQSVTVLVLSAAVGVATSAWCTMGFPCDSRALVKSDPAVRSSWSIT